MKQARKNSAGTPTEVSCNFLLASRSLLVVFVLLLAATPWTEGYRLLDNFPRGQDSELNLLALVAFLGLYLLLTRVSRRTLRAMVAVARNLAEFVPCSGAAPSIAYGPPIQAGITVSPPSGFTLPLLI